MINKKIRACAALCLLFICCLLSLSSCDLQGIASDMPSIINPGNGDKGGVYIDGKLTNTIEPEYKSDIFTSFDKMQQNLYCAAYTALSGMHNEFKITGIDYEEYMDEYAEVLTALINDFPEFFWLNGYVEANAEYLSNSDVGNVTFTMGVYDYWKNKNISDAAEELEAKIDSILYEIEKNNPGNDYEKAKLAHHLIVNSVEYDIESYDKGDSIDSRSDAFTNSVYGALTDGKALCGGYAKAFSLLMHRMGIECEYVTGKANDGPHAWNVIRLEGEYYHVDLTWDDSDGENDNVLYNYFCVTDEDISKTHTIDKEYRYIKANGEKYNYFVYESLYFDEYDFDAINTKSAERAGESVFAIRFKTEEAMDDAVLDLLTFGKIDDLSIVAGATFYTDMIDENLYIITIVIIK